MARAGSKRLRHKHRLKIGDKKLIDYTIDAALNSKSIDHVYVYTDDKDLYELRNEAKLTYITRPERTSQDLSTTIESLRHALNAVPELYTNVVLLQPTSPFRTNQHIDAAVKLKIMKDCRAVISVTENRHPSAWIFRETPNGRLPDGYLKSNANQRSQDYSKEYTLNGAIYILDRKYVEGHEAKSHIDPEAHYYVMDFVSSIDIDTDEDLEIARRLL